MQFKISKSLIISTGFILLLLIFFRLGSTSSRTTIPNTSTSSTPTNSTTTQSSTSTPPTQPGKVREIAVTAKQFEFSPNPIKVKLGETVRLKITSLDVAHGFSLPEFGINEVIDPGKTVTIEFQATKKGSFPFVCSVACGVGHANMRGTLVVE